MLIASFLLLFCVLLFNLFICVCVLLVFTIMYEFNNNNIQHYCHRLLSFVENQVQQDNVSERIIDFIS